MRRILTLLVGFLLLPALSPAEPYVVSLATGEGKVAKRIDLAAYQPLGLKVHRELRNLPGVLLVEMPPATVALVREKGFEVEEIPEYRLLDEVSPPWNLDRENQRRLPLDGDISRPYTGRGTRIVIFDSEFYRSWEFEDRIVEALDYVGDGEGPFAGCEREPGSHGTGMASLAAGSVYGVAPGASLSLIRIFDCKANFVGLGFLTALDDLITWKKEHADVPTVVNMSFGGEGRGHTTQQKLFRILDRLGVLLVDAAGNDGLNACQFTPAGFPETISVGASDIEDHKPLFSGWGTCVDLFAPGQDIRSSRGTGRDESISTGTSDSAAATSGTIALILEQIPGLTSAEVKKVLLANATQGILRGDFSDGSPSRLLYSGPVREEVTKLTARWFPSEKRFSVQVIVSLNGRPTPLTTAKLYRGRAAGGQCQGVPFATVTLANGSGTATIRGWKEAPTYVCIETRAKTVAQRAVKDL